MAATQRPATQEALVEPSGERSLWKTVPQPGAGAELFLEASRLPAAA